MYFLPVKKHKASYKIEVYLELINKQKDCVVQHRIVTFTLNNPTTGRRRRFGALFARFCYKNFTSYLLVYIGI